MESKYYWLDPNGKLHSVPSEGHWGYATEYLKRIGVDNPIDPYEEMYKRGWARVCSYGYESKYYVSFNHSTKINVSRVQMDTLKEMAIESVADEIHDDATGKRYDVWE